MDRIEIYKKLIKEIGPKLPDSYRDICKLIMKEDIDEFKKYLIMYALTKFNFIHIKDNVYIYSTNKELYERYIDYYNRLVEGLDVKIKFNFYRRNNEHKTT